MQIVRVVGITLILVWGFTCHVFGQIDQEKVAEFARKFSDTHDMTLAEVNTIMDNARFQESIIRKMEKPAEGTMTWESYRNIFIQKDRIAAGVAFWDKHEAILNEVSSESGVPVEIILGILGVETFFGQRIGSYRVLDALYTLAFGYPKRSSFFTAELEKFLELSYLEGLDVYGVKGSYAGAIGYCQFMPSSYIAYAKSFNRASNRDLMQIDDAIASVANYLNEHRWKTGEPMATQVAKLIDPQAAENGIRPKNTLKYYSDLGYIPSGNYSPALKAALVKLENKQDAEFWFGFDNFYVITRYNHSAMYAMAVYQLGEVIREQRMQP